MTQYTSLFGEPCQIEMQNALALSIELIRRASSFSAGQPTDEDLQHTLEANGLFQA